MLATIDRLYAQTTVFKGLAPFVRSGESLAKELHLGKYPMTSRCRIEEP